MLEPASAQWTPVQSAPSVPENDRGRVSERSVRTYDEVDLRLMDTFPASDAVARY